MEKVFKKNQIYLEIIHLNEKREKKMDGFE